MEYFGRNLEQNVRCICDTFVIHKAWFVISKYFLLVADVTNTRPTPTERKLTYVFSDFTFFWNIGFPAETHIIS